MMELDEFRGKRRMTTTGLSAITNFRRRLAARLAIAGVIWAVFAGGAAYVIETESLDAALVDQAQLEAALLDAQLMDASGTGGVEPLLNDLIRDRAASNHDHFVLAELYDADRTALGEAVLPAFAFVEEHFDRSSHQFPEDGDAWYRKRLIDGDPYLQVMVPLAHQAGGPPRGWFEGIYRISANAIETMRAGILMITGVVMIAVAGTAAVLYPLMSGLQAHAVGKAKDLLRANLETLKLLGNAIAKRDSDTNTHNYRVTLYAVAIAEALELDNGFIQGLIKGSFLHDVGKIAIPDAILLKPGRLDADEFAIMRTHVTHGLDIIKPSAWLDDAAAVVGGHHEKVDGSGYPLGIYGERIPLEARIFAVADVFDALTSKRPYKEAMSIEKALAIMEDGRDAHFDGKVLDVGIKVLPPMCETFRTLPDDEVEAIADHTMAATFPLS